MAGPGRYVPDATEGIACAEVGPTVGNLGNIAGNTEEFSGFWVKQGCLSAFAG